MRSFDTPILPAAAPAQIALAARLRSETRQAHEALEQALDLTAATVGAGRMRALLSRFYGFHRVWEPAIAASEIGAFAAPRARLESLRTDLMRFGLTEAQLAGLPGCEAAAALARHRPAAIGSLYVLEGSTLGGQVIGKIMQGEAWSPTGGLAYFNPYGKQTAVRWREFLAWADTTADHAEHDQVVAGATATFRLLSAWLAP